MRIRLTVFLGSLWSAAFLMGTSCAGQPDSRTGTIEFVVSDSYGKALKSFQIQVRPLDRGSSVSPRTLNAPGGAIRLPFGEYLVTGDASLHQSFQRRVLLMQERLVVLVGFSFRDQAHTPYIYTALKGRIIGGQITPGSTLMRAVAVWGTFQKETRVLKDGRFEMEEVPYGEYLILVLRDSELVAVKRFVRTLREEEAVIDLGSVGRP